MLLFLTACNPFKPKDSRSKVQEIDFEIEKVQLTKLFQKTEAYAEFKPKLNPSNPNERLRLVISAGLNEASGLEVNKIVRDNNDLNIYINTLNGKSSSLVIPQAIVLIDSEDIVSTNNIKFNIIDETDLEPIKLKIEYNDALSIIESKFKLNTIISPSINLFKSAGDLIWEIIYDPVMDKSEKTLPLVKLKVKIDANSGDIVSENKIKLSYPLDTGNIIGFYKDKYIVYKKDLSEKDKTREELWLYNIFSNEKSLLFSSEFQISNAHINNSGSYISFIETNGSGSNLYIVPSYNKKAYKFSSEKDINPVLNNWIDNDNICLVEVVGNKSIIYNYNLPKNKLTEIASLDKKISSLASRANRFLFIEEDVSTFNDNIYITKDFKDLDLIDQGYNPKFLNDNTLAYMKSKESKEENYIYIYNLEKEALKFKFDGLIPNYQVVDDFSLVYPIKSDGYNSYILKEYNYRDDSLREFSSSITDKTYYSKGANRIYINLNSPFESENNMLIYPLALK